MKIDSSSVQLAAFSEKKEVYTKKETVEYWETGGDSRITETVETSENPGVSTKIQEQPAFVVDVSSVSQQVGSNLFANTSRVGDDFKFNIRDHDRAMMIALQKMIQALTGKKFKFTFLDGLEALENSEFSSISQLAATNNFGWGMHVRSSESYVETETMSFNAEGSVKTADGRTINFSVELTSSRMFATAHNFQLSMGDALIDPLVINFSPENAGLTNAKFRFDLDADGTSDQISRLAPGSGFLALDKNGDGTINDGNELFGTRSGDGFADLAAYDSDGNQWIDENDPIYDKLRIWTMDAYGNSKLVALGQKGIGAIYLGNVETEFSYKNSENETNGELRRTGVFLRENGTAGTIQHIDFAI